MKIFYTIFIFVWLVQWVRAMSLSKSNEIGTPCSTNITSVWLDMIFIIDVSTNMGIDNLKQLGISLASELTKFSISQSLTYSSRVAIITYAGESSQIADFGDFFSTQQAANAFLNLSSLASKSSSVAGLADSIQTIYNMVLDHKGSYNNRIIATMFFAASIKDANVNSQLLNYVAGTTTAITVNFNPSDSDLTTFLNGLAPNYNFTKDTSLYTNLEWALTQANCYCPSGRLQFEHFDNIINRIRYYADCYEGVVGFMSAVKFNLDQGTNVSDLCNFWFTDKSSVPMFIESVEKMDFMTTNDYFVDANMNYFMGLHKTSSNFMWWDYNWSEFPLGNFSVWAKGYPKIADNCAYISRTKAGEKFQWKSTSCDNSNIGVICSWRACDAGNYCYAV